jgi:hypothetical protein
MLDARCWMLDAGFTPLRISNSESRTRIFRLSSCSNHRGLVPLVTIFCSHDDPAHLDHQCRNIVSGGSLTAYLP